MDITENYDEMKKVTDMGMAAGSRFYEIYIQPFFKATPENKPFWFNAAHNAWRLSVSKYDLLMVKFVEWLCEDLAKNAQGELIELLTQILEAMYDTSIRTEQAEENLWHSKVAADNERIFSDQIRLYKVLFENEFRLWATIPYYFACKNHGIKNKVKDVALIHNIGASEKFQALKSIAVALPKGSLTNLIVGLDNQIRNAGEGHDRWEITDKETLIFPVVDSQTGEEKQKIELSKQQLEDYLKQCRKTIWILKIGCLVFLENNKSIRAKLQSKKIYKAREIEAALQGFAKNRLFDITKFKLSEDRTRLEFSIKYTPQIVGEGGQIFFGSGERYDVINKVSKTNYHYQMLDVIKYALLYFNKDNLPIVNVEMLDENVQLLGVVEYEHSELTKLLQEDGQQEIPQPSKGQAPEKECQIVSEIRVPYGTRHLFEKMIQDGKLDT